jgi:hypothetical protein
VPGSDASRVGSGPSSGLRPVVLLVVAGAQGPNASARLILPEIARADTTGSVFLQVNATGSSALPQVCGITHAPAWLFSQIRAEALEPLLPPGAPVTGSPWAAVDESPEVLTILADAAPWSQLVVGAAPKHAVRAAIEAQHTPGPEPEDGGRA